MNGMIEVSRLKDVNAAELFQSSSSCAGRANAGFQFLLTDNHQEIPQGGIVTQMKPDRLLLLLTP
jgi:hypothetical protein